jgi:urease accessory protein
MAFSRCEDSLSIMRVSFLIPIYSMANSLLALLQLASPGLPVGAYSYSEGLEWLVEEGRIGDRLSLEHWLRQELQLGAVRLEAAVAVRCHRAMQAQDFAQLMAWNEWLSATRDAEELRLQSWQMGRSLLNLLLDLQPELGTSLPVTALQAKGCNFVTAFAIAAATWQIDLESAILAYLHSWATNLISAGVKLIPLGQTAAQQLLLALQPALEQASHAILKLPDVELAGCGWGLSLASMAHETQYSRLFRS